MTEHQHKPHGTGDVAPSHTARVDREAFADTESFAANLFDQVLNAQIGLFGARLSRDVRAAEQHRLALRTNALLLACLPVHPDSRAAVLKVAAATSLREEDGSEASHAWLMAEFALELDQRRHAPPFTDD